MCAFIQGGSRDLFAKSDCNFSISWQTHCISWADHSPRPVRPRRHKTDAILGPPLWLLVAALWLWQSQNPEN
jgi:hypothetical protein